MKKGKVGISNPQRWPVLGMELSGLFPGEQLSQMQTKRTLDNGFIRIWIFSFSLAKHRELIHCIQEIAMQMM